MTKLSGLLRKVKPMSPETRYLLIEVNRDEETIIGEYDSEEEAEDMRQEMTDTSSCFATYYVKTNHAA